MPYDVRLPGNHAGPNTSRRCDGRCLVRICAILRALNTNRSRNKILRL